MSTLTKFKVGDTVHIPRTETVRYAGTYTVTKVNPTTYRLKNKATGEELRASHEVVRAGGALNGPTITDPVAVVPIPEVFHPGAVVKARGLRGTAPDALFVVTGSAPKGYRLFPLGGSSRYFTGVPAERLTRVTEINGWKA